MPSGAAHRGDLFGSGTDGDGCEKSDLVPAWRGIVYLMTAINPGETTLFVCVTCREKAVDGVQNELARPGARLLAAINAAPDARRESLAVQPVECLSNCNRACTVAVAASGKWTYVIGALDPDVHADDVLAFALLHRAHEAGLPAWRERPEYIRKNTISRVPPLPSRAPEEV
jgi:predicted metal-binding protein